MRVVAISGTLLRVEDAAWTAPLDPGFAARPPGRRWNPPGLPCLYLNRDEHTARCNVRRLFDGLPYGPEDLDPATAPVLIEVSLPPGRAVDAATDQGLIELGLPASYPLDADGALVPHGPCQAIGRAGFDLGHDGVEARSAAAGGGRELAWFPRGRPATQERRRSFDEWW